MYGSRVSSLSNILLREFVSDREPERAMNNLAMSLSYVEKSIDH